ncbi:MAG: hypothetical protein Kow00123_00600 [Anaerolineales bacterium]
MSEQRRAVNLSVHLYPPLNSAAGSDRVQIALDAPATVGDALEALVARYGAEMRRYLYGDGDTVVPAWTAFVNDVPVQLNRDEALQTPVSDGDELALILNLAGG